MPHEPDTQNDPMPRRALSGRWLVAGTLSLFLVIPVITFLSWRLTQGDPPRLQLDYSERADWFMQPVKPRPLRYSTFVAAETGKEYKKTDLTIDPAVESVLLSCAKLAQGEDFFDDDATRDTLLGYAEDEANGFYPAYLLASWYGVNDEPTEHDRWMQAAYHRAGGALTQRLVDEAGQPVAGFTLPPVAIGYDRVIEGKRNATLVLIYPAPISEADGHVYLPTFRSVYRLTDPALPLGVDPGLHPIELTLLPQPPKGKQPNWFAVPDGAVGRLPDAEITSDIRFDLMSQQQLELLNKKFQEASRGLAQ